MRITETRMIDLAAMAVQKNRSKVAEAAAEASSGVRVDRPSKDPTAWASGMRAQLRDAANTQRESNIASAREKLQATDGALDGVGRVLGRATELAVQLSNGTYNAEERAGAAAEVAALFASALGSANAKGPDGSYLLSGTEQGAKPFGGDGVYVGNDVTHSIETREGQLDTVTMTGDALTANAGVDIFTTLGKLQSALEQNDQDNIAGVLGDLSTAVGQVAQARTEVGSMMGALDGARDTAEQFEQNFAEWISREVGADPIEAASNLAQFMTALETSRAVAGEIVSIASGKG